MVLGMEIFWNYPLQIIYDNDISWKAVLHQFYMLMWTDMKWCCNSTSTGIQNFDVHNSDIIKNKLPEKNHFIFKLSLT